MRTMMYQKYGSPNVLQMTEVSKPTPNEDEILIKIYATTVTQGDCRMRRADPFMARLYNGLIKPKRLNVLGFELAGIVECIGSKVNRFEVGDEVFAFTGFGFGAYAEYRCLPESGSYKKGIVSLKPINMTFEEAAAVPCGGLTALSILRQANIQEGQNVLIYGASGSVGTYAVQIAKHRGAHVTGVCSTKNIELVKSIGADDVIDYTKEDFSENDVHYDFVFDAVAKSSPSKCKKVLKKDGLYRAVTSSTTIADGDLTVLKELIEANELRPVIDKQYPFEQIAEAHEYVEKGHKSGNVIIQIERPSD